MATAERTLKRGKDWHAWGLKDRRTGRLEPWTYRDLADIDVSTEVFRAVRVKFIEVRASRPARPRRTK